jgi:hypothetical protein
MLGKEARIFLVRPVVCVADVEIGVTEFDRLNKTATKTWGKMKALRLDIMSVAQLRQLLHTYGEKREHTAAVRGVRLQNPARMCLQPYGAALSKGL